ncbi:MAG: hypothetical protein JXR96_07265 [Deltaproteobacteria bacterium]|nr:hypothetical protein [Deltaproteobacteria bacterium]
MDLHVIGGLEYPPAGRASLRVVTQAVFGLFDRRPLPLARVRIELLGPQGRRAGLFDGRTDLCGTLSPELVLPDWPTGPYRMRVEARSPFASREMEASVEREVWLRRRAHLVLRTDRRAYLAGQPVRVRGLAFYQDDGRPASGLGLRLRAVDLEGREIAAAGLHTDSLGAGAAELRLDAAGASCVRLVLDCEAATCAAVPVQQSACFVPAARGEAGSAPGEQRTVSDEAGLRLEVACGGRRLLLGVPNRLLVRSTRPDGTPAAARVELFAAGRAAGAGRTGPDGLGELFCTPEPGWDDGGSGRVALRLVARDEGGAIAERRLGVRLDARGVLLDTDRSIYAAGELVQVLVRTAPSAPFVFLDLARAGRMLRTEVVPVSGGVGRSRFPIPPELAGARIELHAYRIEADGTIPADARALQVLRADPLEIEIVRDQPVFRPGQRAEIRLRVSGPTGSARPALLGLWARETKPGAPHAGCDPLPPTRSQLGRRGAALSLELARERPAGLQPWSRPVRERMAAAEPDRRPLAEALKRWARTQDVGWQDAQGRWHYRQGLVRAMVESGALGADAATDPLGSTYSAEAIERIWPVLGAERILGRLELEELWALRNALHAKLFERSGGWSRLEPDSVEQQLQALLPEVLEAHPVLAADASGRQRKWESLRGLPGFRPRDFLLQAHERRVQQAFFALSRYGRENERWWRVSVLDAERDAYRLPPDALERAVRRGLLAPDLSRDLWGRPLVLRERDTPREKILYSPRLRFWELVSAGQDGVPGSEDDLVFTGTCDGGRAELKRKLTADEGPIDFGRLQIDAVEPGVSAKGEPVDGEGACGPLACEHARPDELVLFEPALATDDEGRARIELVLPEREAVWRLDIAAHDRLGARGCWQHTIRVEQPSSDRSGPARSRDR